MTENKESFNEYMEFFKTQTLKEKQSIIVDQMKTLAGFTNSLCEEIGGKSEMLLNRELIDLNKTDYTEDDFAEALIVLVNSIQNSICDLSNTLADMADTIQ